jgi:hypothetical protein
MHNNTIATALAAVLLAASAGPAGAAPAKAPPTTPGAVTTFAVDCRAGPRVTAAERAAVGARALENYNHIMGGRAEEPYALMSPSLRGEIGLSNYQETVDWAKETDKISDPRVTAVWMLDVEGTPPEQTTVCEDADGAPAAYVELSRVPAQAHVLIEATEADGNVWTFSTWLHREGDTWWIYAFDPVNSATGRTDAEGLWALARAQRAAGAEDNARLLYRFAYTLSHRGRTVTLPIRADILREGEEAYPGMLEAESVPVHWNDGRVTYGAHHNVATGDKDGLYIMLYRSASVWKGDRAVDAENREMLKSYMRNNPKWSDAFVGVFIHAGHPDGEAWLTTSYVTGEGWSKPAK